MSPRVRRVLISLGVAVVACGVYVWFFGFQTMMILETRWMARNSPVIWMTPRGLPTTSIASGPGKKLKYFGYEFDVPWDDFEDSRTRTGVNWAVVRFRSGDTIKVTTLPPREFVNGILKLTGKDRRIYGNASMQSDYAMWSLIARATPEKITLFGSRREAFRTSMLLGLKAISAPEDSGIFSIQTGKFKGFQWGDPQAHPTHIVADLFSDDGGVEFVFLGPASGKPRTISQAEINRVLQTVHKVKLPERKAQAQVTAVSPPK